MFRESVERSESGNDPRKVRKGQETVNRWPRESQNRIQRAARENPGKGPTKVLKESSESKVQGPRRVEIRSR